MSRRQAVTDYCCAYGTAVAMYEYVPSMYLTQKDRSRLGQAKSWRATYENEAKERKAQQTGVESTGGRPPIAIGYVTIPRTYIPACMCASRTRCLVLDPILQRTTLLVVLYCCAVPGTGWISGGLLGGVCPFQKKSPMYRFGRKCKQHLNITVKN